MPLPRDKHDRFFSFSFFLSSGNRRENATGRPGLPSRGAGGGFFPLFTGIQEAARKDGTRPTSPSIFPFLLRGSRRVTRDGPAPFFFLFLEARLKKETTGVLPPSSVPVPCGTCRGGGGRFLFFFFAPARDGETVLHAVPLPLRLDSHPEREGVQRSGLFFPFRLARSRDRRGDGPVSVRPLFSPVIAEDGRRTPFSFPSS